MEKNIRLNDEGKITAVELAGEMVPLEEPADPGRLEEIQSHIQWLEENLSLGTVDAEKNSRKWSEEELREFIEARIRKDKHNQLIWLSVLANNAGIVKKEEMDEAMEKYSDRDEWSPHSLGGMKGGLANKIKGKDKEKLWEDRKNSGLEHGEYRIKEEYREVIQDVLSDYPRKPGDN